MNKFKDSLFGKILLLKWSEIDLVLLSMISPIEYVGVAIALPGAVLALITALVFGFITGLVYFPIFVIAFALLQGYILPRMK